MLLAVMTIAYGVMNLFGVVESLSVFEEIQPELLVFGASGFVVALTIVAFVLSRVSKARNTKTSKYKFNEVPIRNHIIPNAIVSIEGTCGYGRDNSLTWQYTGTLTTGGYPKKTAFNEGKLIISDGTMAEGKFTGKSFGGLVIVNFAMMPQVYRTTDGCIINGKLMEGILRYPNGDVYEGKINLLNDSIKAVLRYANGDVYEGEISAAKTKQGKGILTTSNGLVLEGDWSNDGFIDIDGKRFTILLAKYFCRPYVCGCKKKREVLWILPDDERLKTLRCGECGCFYSVLKDISEIKKIQENNSLREIFLENRRKQK